MLPDYLRPDAKLYYHTPPECVYLDDGSITNTQHFVCKCGQEFDDFHKVRPCGHKPGYLFNIWSESQFNYLLHHSFIYNIKPLNKGD